MPIIHFKRLLALVVLFGGIVLRQPVQAQFIRLTISLPAGFEAKPDPYVPQVLEPPMESGSTSLGLRRQGIRWIEFRTRENIYLAISAKFDPKTGSLPAMYFLNNNTTDFNNATSLSPFRSVVSMYEDQRLIRDFPDETNYLSAWLGIPSDRSGLLTIEFH